MVHILRSTSLWGGGGLPDTIMPTFRGGGGKKYPKMYYVVCERSLEMFRLLAVLQRSFKDLRSSKIHLRLCLRPISKSRRIFEASKILGRRFRRFFQKKSSFVEEILRENGRK